MSIELPGPIARYFAADKRSDATAIANIFTDDAIVQDERRTYAGRDAIQQWKIASSGKYTYTVDPFAIADEAGVTVITARLVGDFPGSPIDLRYRFSLDNDRIAGLEIAP